MGQAINKTVTIGATSAVHTLKRPEAQQQSTPPPHHPAWRLWQDPTLAPFPVISCLCEARKHSP